MELILHACRLDGEGRHVLDLRALLEVDCVTALLRGQLLVGRFFNSEVVVASGLTNALCLLEASRRHKLQVLRASVLVCVAKLSF